jgi:RNA polymerase sigma-70 factor (ECF subfamily)
MRMMTSDESLARAAAGGDGAAFASLVERHYELVFRVAWRILGNRADAEDLAQDVCVALPGKLRNYRGEARYTTWLYRVTVNAARDLFRRSAARARAGDGWGDLEALARAEAEERTEALAWLGSAMQALRPELRETVALVLGEEMSHAGAGDVLGVSEGTVSWRMSEVRKALRAQAEKEARV